MRSQDSSVGIVTGWTAGVIFPVEAKIVLFSTASRPALGPTQSGGFSLVVKWSRVKVTSHLQLVPMSIVELYLHSPIHIGEKR
jgi:hypothetical protein